MNRMAAFLAAAAVAAVSLAAPAWAQVPTPAERGIMTPPMDQQSMPADTQVNWVNGQRYIDRGNPADRVYGNPPFASGYGYPYAAAYGYGYPDTAPYGYPYANPYGYWNESANPFSVVTAPIAALTAPVSVLAAFEATAPSVTGRSVATGQMGRMCSTPVKSCELYRESFVGNGCSCKVSGGRARGTVAP
ncbi:hypothetical protein QEV83_07910 [Methylocapsa sp. D3K7]|uniref:hypothetical protein n=1 Tax=Methylocapsa sp. D3K7 TaxID=3041435 RepID=UPI00244E9435|nr:hypothetical protein [Methylocapsa sp. D3K7]WGJ16157.1 hypothetical protein QEV83_07910 [Methylocapsa sp. D3K7]